MGVHQRKTSGTSKSTRSSANHLTQNLADFPTEETQHPRHIAAIFALSILLHWNTLSGGFVYDDARGVVTNDDVIGVNPLSAILVNDFWGKPMSRYQSHKSYRPLSILSFRMCHEYAGLEPFVYHLVNVLLHGVVCVLFFRTAASVLIDPNHALVAAILFTVHSVHTEAVANIVGRAEVLGGLFFLLSFELYRKACGPTARPDSTSLISLFGSMTCVAAAMLSKEQGLTALGVLAIFDACCVCQLHPWDALRAIFPSTMTQRRWIQQFQYRITVIAATGIVLIAFRIWMMGGGKPIFNDNELPALAHPSTIVRSLTFNFYVVVNAMLLMLPVMQCSDWSYGSIPLVENFFDSRVIAIAALYIALTTATLMILSAIPRALPRELYANFKGGKECSIVKQSIKNDVAAAALGLGWLGITFLPSSNLLFYVGFVVAERVLYLPSMGYSILAALVYKYSWQKSRLVARAALIALVLFLAVKTFQRNAAWHSDYTLHEVSATDNPNNVKMATNFGMLQHDRAKEMHRNDAERAHYLKSAESTYSRALKHLKPGERFPNLFFVYGNLLQETDREERAITMYQKGLQLKDNTKVTLNLLNNLGTLFYKMNRYDESELAFKECLGIDTTHLSARNGLAVLFATIGKIDLAEAEFKMIMEQMPDYPEGHFNYGTLLAKAPGRLKDAEQQFKKTIRLNPGHTGAQTNLKYVQYQLEKGLK